MTAVRSMVQKNQATKVVRVAVLVGGLSLIGAASASAESATGEAQGVPVYRMRCASTGALEGEGPQWKNYEISYDPKTKEFSMDSNGDHTVFPSPMIAMEDGNQYFTVATQTQVNTQYGLATLNVSARLPARSDAKNELLNFQIGIPHGRVLRLDPCSSIVSTK